MNRPNEINTILANLEPIQRDLLERYINTLERRIIGLNQTVMNLREKESKRYDNDGFNKTRYNKKAR